MGRDIKPSEVKELEGDLGKRGIPEEAEIELGSLVPPEGLEKKARKYWRKFAPVLRGIGTLTMLQEQTFKRLCQIWALLDGIYDYIMKENKSLMQVTNNYGESELRESDYSKAYRAYTKDALSLEKAFKLTPDKMAGSYKPKRKTDEMEDLLD